MLGGKVAQFANNQEFFQFVRESILRLHRSGHSTAALRLSDGFRLMNGLTDGWADFLESVQGVQSEFGQALPPEERDALEVIRAAAYGVVYHR